MQLLKWNTERLP